MVPGKKIEVNEGIRFLTGKGKIDIPLRKKEEAKDQKKAEDIKQAPVSFNDGPVTSKCTIEENGKSRTFMVTVESMTSGEETQPQAEEKSKSNGEFVYSSFSGTVDVVDILVKVGDSVQTGQTVAQVEAMKAKHDIKSPRAGKVTSIAVSIGDEIDSGKPIMSIE
jgi:biotin carboxyl carrier protein